MKRLPSDVVSALRTDVTITSAPQSVTELVLNSIDAKSSSIAVRVDLSLFKLQVIDNGCGISESDLQLLGNRYMTSKCQCLEDLRHNLSFFGFRGEALASLCEVSGTVMISSRAAGSGATFCKTISQGRHQKVVAASRQRPAQGTTVFVGDFLYNRLVRRARIKAAFDLEDIKTHLECTALIHPEISFSLRDDSTGQIILETRKSNTVVDTFSSLFGSAIAKTLCAVKQIAAPFEVSGYISKEAYAHKNLQFIYINKRLLLKTKLHKLINSIMARSSILKVNNVPHNPISKELTSAFFLAMSPPKRAKHAVYMLNITCPYAEYDITLDPKKTLIEFRNWDIILNCIEKLLRNFLEPELTPDSPLKGNSLMEEIDRLAREDALSRDGVCGVLTSNLGARSVLGLPARRDAVNFTPPSQYTPDTQSSEKEPTLASLQTVSSEVPMSCLTNSEDPFPPHLRGAPGHRTIQTASSEDPFVASRNPVTRNHDFNTTSPESTVVSTANFLNLFKQPIPKKKLNQPKLQSKLPVGDSVHFDLNLRRITNMIRPPVLTNDSEVERRKRSIFNSLQKFSKGKSSQISSKINSSSPEDSAMFRTPENVEEISQSVCVDTGQSIPDLAHVSDLEARCDTPQETFPDPASGIPQSLPNLETRWDTPQQTLPNPASVIAQSVSGTSSDQSSSCDSDSKESPAVNVVEPSNLDDIPPERNPGSELTSSQTDYFCGTGSTPRIAECSKATVSKDCSLHLSEEIFIRDETRNTRKETEIVRDETHNTQKETEIVRDETHNTQKETEIVRDETHNTQKETEIVRDETHNTQKETEIVRNEIHNTQKETEIVRDETHNTQKETEIFRDETHNIQKETEIMSANPCITTEKNGDIRPTRDLFESNERITNILSPAKNYVSSEDFIVTLKDYLRAKKNYVVPNENQIVSSDEWRSSPERDNLSKLSCQGESSVSGFDVARKLFSENSEMCAAVRTDIVNKDVFSCESSSTGSGKDYEQPCLSTNILESDSDELFCGRNNKNTEVVLSPESNCPVIVEESAGCPSDRNIFTNSYLTDDFNSHAASCGGPNAELSLETKSSETKASRPVSLSEQSSRLEQASSAHDSVEPNSSNNMTLSSLIHISDSESWGNSNTTAHNDYPSTASMLQATRTHTISSFSTSAESELSLNPKLKRSHATIPNFDNQDEPPRKIAFLNKIDSQNKDNTCYDVQENFAGKNERANEESRPIETPSLSIKNSSLSKFVDDANSVSRRSVILECSILEIAAMSPKFRDSRTKIASQPDPKRGSNTSVPVTDQYCERIPVPNRKIIQDDSNSNVFENIATQTESDANATETDNEEAVFTEMKSVGVATAAALNAAEINSTEADGKDVTAAISVGTNITYTDVDTITTSRQPTHSKDNINRTESDVNTTETNLGEVVSTEMETVVHATVAALNANSMEADAMDVTVEMAVETNVKYTEVDTINTSTQPSRSKRAVAGFDTPSSRDEFILVAYNNAMTKGKNNLEGTIKEPNTAGSREMEVDSVSTPTLNSDAAFNTFSLRDESILQAYRSAMNKDKTDSEGIEVLTRTAEANTESNTIGTLTPCNNSNNANGDFDISSSGDVAILKAYNDVMINKETTINKTDAIEDLATVSKTFPARPVLDEPNAIDMQSSDAADTNGDYWEAHTDSSGRKFFVHAISGAIRFADLGSSGNQEEFTIQQRCQFIPKGLSPMMESHVMPSRPTQSLDFGENDPAVSRLLDQYAVKPSGISKWPDEDNSGRCWPLLDQFLTGVNGSEPPVASAMVQDCSHSQIRVYNVCYPYTFDKKVFQNLKVLGQLDHKFIVTVARLPAATETKEVIVLFDQHAVHERIRVEQLTEDYREPGPGINWRSAPVHPALPLSLSAREVRVMANCTEKWRALGLRFSQSDAHSVRITGVPTCLLMREDREVHGRGVSVLKSHLENLIREEVDALIQTRGAGVEQPAIIRNVIASEACRGAVKFGHPLEVKDCRAFLHNLSGCDLPFQCAHGRPALTPIADLSQLPKSTKVEKLNLWKLRPA